jgi:hypothetical protein
MLEMFLIILFNSVSVGLGIFWVLCILWAIDRWERARDNFKATTRVFK